MKKETIELATKLYFDLPWWKRLNSRKWYKENNWDVTGVWAECLEQADTMILEATVKLK